MSQSRHEVALASEVIWRKSSFSGGQGECLELALNVPDLAPVRDNKSPTSPVIPFTRDAWSGFISHLR